MPLSTTPHINFRGRARAALDFYGAVFGGHVAITTYADAGMPADAPGADGVLFGVVATQSGAAVMAYDIPGTPAATPPGGSSTHREHGTTITDQPFFVALGGDSLDELTPLWDALAAGAKIVEPLAASAWSPGFGMLTDRFGVTWALSVTPES